jgi:DNA-directed RNA polymerase specialized sigma24 family protein
MVLQAAGGNETKVQQALGRLCEVYRQPVLRWLQRTGTPRDTAEEFTQAFMEHLLEVNYLESYEQREAKFRSFLIKCLKWFLRGEWRKRQAGKRGGGIEHVDFDEAALGVEMDLDAVIDLQFAVEVHRQALLALATGWYAEEPKRTRFQELKRFIWDADGPSYAEVGERLRMKPNHVKKEVFDLRHRYFEAFRREVIETVTPELVDEEARYLLELLAKHRDSWTVFSDSVSP